MDYGKIYHRFWTSKTVRSWDDATKLLATYLRTSRHSTTEGYFHLPIAYIAADMGWDIPKVEKAFAELDASDFARYDPEAEVVLVVKAVQWDPPKGPKQVTGAVRRIEETPSSDLLVELATRSKGYSDELHQALNTPSEGYQPVDNQDEIPLRYPFDSSSSSSSSNSSSNSSSSSTAREPDDDDDPGTPATPTTNPIDGTWRQHNTPIPDRGTPVAITRACLDWAMDQPGDQPTILATILTDHLVAGRPDQQDTDDAIHSFRQMLQTHTPAQILDALHTTLSRPPKGVPNPVGYTAKILSNGANT